MGHIHAIEQALNADVALLQQFFQDPITTLQGQGLQILQEYHHEVRATTSRASTLMMSQDTGKSGITLPGIEITISIPLG